MKIFSLVAIATICLSAQAFAGAADAIVKCKSASGRTMIDAVYPVDSIEGSMTFKVDNASVTYETNEASKTAVIASRSRNNLAMVVTQDTGGKVDLILLDLRSVGRIRKSALPYGGELLKFNAVVGGLDPRLENESALPQINVTCTYDYHI